ncbi:MAG: hypothetical protein IPF95_05555 [Flavobacteriales bacterium]|nr:hypothetical protein [Flavobacteriales bacterium]MBK6944104.1 hypothetical protein [Flavobacteriales bacterium]MBK7295403.1 hypothetical protein [Flavobacteriales bacterium]HQV51176.1 DUF6427 family protein [Flavobacteriales bacterium]HQX37050.1 DUF6427 family protein [Flavobacteriales bacterium]
MVIVPALFLPWVWDAGSTPRVSMPFHQAMLVLVNETSWIRGTAGMVVIILVAIQLTALVNNSELMLRRNHLPALFFPLLLAAFGDPVPIGPALFGMPFLLFALQRTWSITNMGSALGPLFDAGLLIGIASLFYLPYAFMVVVVWASVSVIRPFFWRDHLVPFLGVAVVLYLAWGILKLMGVEHWRPLYTIMDRNTLSTHEVVRSQRVLFYFLLAAFIGTGALAFAKGYGSGVMREKNLRSSFLAYCAATIVLSGLLWMLSKRFPPVIVAVPLAILCGYAVNTNKRAWVGELGVLALGALAVWGMWG